MHRYSNLDKRSSDAHLSLSYFITTVCTGFFNFQKKIPPLLLKIAKIFRSVSYRPFLIS